MRAVDSGCWWVLHFSILVPNSLGFIEFKYGGVVFILIAGHAHISATHYTNVENNEYNQLSQPHLFIELTKFNMTGMGISIQPVKSNIFGSILTTNLRQWPTQND